MWNPFSPRSKSAESSADNVDHAKADPTPEIESGPLAFTGPRTSSIAEIEIIGTTAVATLTVTELTLEHGVEMLAELLEELQESGARHFVLDIQNVQYMDSACLGCLVEVLNKMSSSGGRIALANTANRVQYLFRLTRLDRVFPICQDVMAAIEAVERAAA